MAYDLIKISALPETTPDESQDIVIGDGDYAKRINYGDVKADMVGTSPTYTTDTEPYLMRQTAHTGIVGKCALEKLVGGSLGWNQLVTTTYASGTYSGVTVTNNGDGSWTLNGTTTARLIITLTSLTILNGHKYFCFCDFPSNKPNGVYFGIAGASIDTGSGGIFNATSTIATNIRLDAPTAGTVFNNMKITPQVTDLTLAFGSTIADYIYQLETATVGAGIAKLKSWGIDLGTYHAYDAGSIQSVQATAHVTTGFNAWDEAWEIGRYNWSTGQPYADTTRIRSKNYIPVLPSTTYYVRIPNNANADIYFYDGNKTFVSPIAVASVRTFTTPANARYMQFSPYAAYGTTYNNDICINISKPTGTPKNGDYVPYSGHSYPLGSDTLRGIPQLVSNKLQFDGDEKTPDGTIRRRYGIVDLGSLTWSYQSNTGMFYSGGYADMKAGTIKGIVSNGYKLVSGTSIVQSTDKTICKDSNGRLYAHDSAYSTTEAFQTAISGTYMVYEKNSETTESSTAFQKVQTIDADGTESFTTSSPVPVGHETQTPDNILAALGWLGE